MLNSYLSSRFLAYSIRAFLRLLLLTCRFKVNGSEHLHASAKRGSAIIMLWHNQLVLIGPSILKKAKEFTYCALVSNSKDGDILSAYITSYPMGRTIRVPHDSKDLALKTLIERLKLKEEIAIITPDGPRGPRYEMKPGIAVAAKETDAAIIPFTWTANKYWELNTWDKMRIPKPFSIIEASFGSPLYLARESILEEDVAFLKTMIDTPQSHKDH